MKQTLNALAAIVLSGLAGCASLSSEYRRPTAPAGPAWANATERGTVAAERWWTVFGDRNLDRLVDDVLARNSNVATAAIRARRSRLQADLAGNALFPKFSGNMASNANVPLNGANSANSSSSSLSVAYEIDLWGKLASQRDAAAFEAVATVEDFLAARVAVTGATVETYWRLAHANQTIASAERSLAYTRQTQELVKSQVAAGASSDIELNEVEQTVEAQAALLVQLRQVRVTTRNSMLVLLDGGKLPVHEPMRLPVRTPKVAPGLPATLLARRPDLRAAELRLRGTLKGVDVSRASFYPTISLTGAMGGSSSELISFISNPVASLGAGVVLPFLNLKDMGLTVGVSEARYEEAVVGFRRALLDAFADVANALGARSEHAQRRIHLKKALDAAYQVERLTERRYRAGAVPLRVFLDAQERRRVAELALIDNRLAGVVAEATLYRAIGGTSRPNEAGNIASKN